MCSSQEKWQRNAMLPELWSPPGIMWGEIFYSFISNCRTIREIIMFFKGWLILSVSKVTVCHWKILAAVWNNCYIFMSNCRRNAVFKVSEGWANCCPSIIPVVSFSSVLHNKLIILRKNWILLHSSGSVVDFNSFRTLLCFEAWRNVVREIINYISGCNESLHWMLWWSEGFICMLLTIICKLRTGYSKIFLWISFWWARKFLTLAKEATLHRRIAYNYHTVMVAGDMIIRISA